MRVIKYRVSYSSKQILKYLFLFSIPLLIYFLWLVIREFNVGPIWGFAVLIGGYSSLYVAFEGLRGDWPERLFNNLVGKYGEDKICKILTASLDDKYTYVRNFTFEGRGDIDGILIGPTCVFLIEIKFFARSYFIRNHLFFLNKESLYPLKFKSPINQALQEEGIFNALMIKENIAVPIRQLLVFCHGCPTWEGKTGVYILSASNLVNHIKEEEIRYAEINPELRNQIVSRLSPK